MLIAYTEISPEASIALGMALQENKVLTSLKMSI